MALLFSMQYKKCNFCNEVKETKEFTTGGFTCSQCVKDINKEK